MELMNILDGARNEIIGGIVVLAVTILLGWVYKTVSGTQKSIHANQARD